MATRLMATRLYNAGQLPIRPEARRSSRAPTATSLSPSVDRPVCRISR
jgi:hypothetical protein